MSNALSYRVLFVDDETHILKGLIRNLKSIEPGWEFFAEASAVDALAFLEKQTVDVVISDLRMPNIDGADFLQAVQRQHPHTIRFILSGQASEELLFKASHSSHRYFIKPCDAHILIRAMQDALQAAKTLAHEKIKDIVIRTGQLPSLPTLYTNLVNALNNPDSIVEDIVKVVGQDPSMVSKIMQVSNSAYFGAAGKITNLHEAVLLLGMDILKGLVLVGKIFEQTSLKNNDQTNFIKDLWFHSIQTGAFAFEIAHQHTNNKKLADEALTAALIHDIGKSIFYEVFENEYLELLKKSKEQNIILWRLEKSSYGNTHAEIGAHLLQLWGLPTVLSEAVEFHHTPYQASQKSFSALTAVHIANILEHEQTGESQSYTAGKLDIAYLQNLKLTDNLNHWKQMINK